MLVLAVDPIVPPAPCPALVVKINNEDPILNDLWKCFESLLVERGLVQEAISVREKYYSLVLYITIVIIYKQQFLHSDWLRTCQLIPNQCKKV